MSEIAELRCKHCKKPLGKAYGSAIVEIYCSNTSCKAGNQFKILSSDQESDLKFKFAEAPRPPKQKEVEVS